MTEEKMPQKKDQTLLYLMLVVTFAWGVFWLLIIISPHFAQTSLGWAERGQFGDMFGALNALFSGLAFAGIIYTIRQQKEELELQREELRLTREELSKSTQAQQKSEAALKKQYKAMQLTGMLNANKSLLDHYNMILADSNSGAHEKIKAPLEVRRCVKNITDILGMLENLR